MCRACMAAAAAVPAKIASFRGLTAHGVRTLLFRPLPESTGSTPTSEERPENGAPATEVDAAGSD
jgi:hypothetical protein